jgi:hypothetical protein
MENNTIRVFLDAVGRTIFAEELPDRSNEEFLVVKNPVVVHIGSTQEGKMSLQLLPVFFKEFLADKDDDITFTYRRENIAMSDPVTFDYKLYNNYKQMFSNIILPTDAPVDSAQKPKVIDLFDDKK